MASHTFASSVSDMSVWLFCGGDLGGVSGFASGEDGFCSLMVRCKFNSASCKVKVGSRLKLSNRCRFSSSSRSCVNTSNTCTSRVRARETSKQRAASRSYDKMLRARSILETCFKLLLKHLYQVCVLLKLARFDGRGGAVGEG